MADAKKDERKFVMEDKTFFVKDFTEEGKVLFNKLTILEKLILENNDNVIKYTMLTESVIEKRNLIIQELKLKEPLIKNDKESSKAEEKKQVTN
tara:strand:+ start:570 stop:851 length:282 start_codon:yes stop_codon:yes gene_type:complete